LRLIGFGDLRDGCAVGGIDIRKLPLSGHETAVNVILD
jgi:hypothetical protein